MLHRFYPIGAFLCGSVQRSLLALFSSCTLPHPFGRWHDAELKDVTRHISPLKPHNLRHTFAFQLAKTTGADAYELERRLGRRSPRDTQCDTNPPKENAAQYIEAFSAAMGALPHADFLFVAPQTPSTVTACDDKRSNPSPASPPSHLVLWAALRRSARMGEVYLTVNPLIMPRCACESPFGFDWSGTLQIAT